MEIKDFVLTTLRELSEAFEEFNKNGKIVHLTNTALRQKGKGNYGLIDFDLAVEAKTTEKSGGGGGIRIAVLEAKIGKDKELLSSSVSRIKFTIEANF